MYNKGAIGIGHSQLARNFHDSIIPGSKLRNLVDGQTLSQQDQQTFSHLYIYFITWNNIIRYYLIVILQIRCWANDSLVHGMFVKFIWSLMSFCACRKQWMWKDNLSKKQKPDKSSHLEFPSGKWTKDQE